MSTTQRLSSVISVGSICGTIAAIAGSASASICFACQAFAAAIGRVPGSVGWYIATLAPTAKTTSSVQTRNAIT